VVTMRMMPLEFAFRNAKRGGRRIKLSLTIHTIGTRNTGLVLQDLCCKTSATGLVSQDSCQRTRVTGLVSQDSC